MELIAIVVSGIVFPFVIHVGRRLGFTSKQSIAVVSVFLLIAYGIVDLSISRELKQESIQYILGMLGTGNLIYLYILEEFFKEDLPK